MTPYVPSPESDLLLVRWWFQLQEAGELELVFGQGAQTLTSFLDAMRPPRHLLLYEAAEEGLWMAFVVDPILRGAFVSLWLAPRKRKAIHGGLGAIEAAYEAVLATYPLLLGVTRQERILSAHRRWGYTVAAKLPGLFD